MAERQAMRVALNSWDAAVALYREIGDAATGLYVEHFDHTAPFANAYEKASYSATFSLYAVATEAEIADGGFTGPYMVARGF